jgi:hypothetical protein
MLNISITCKLSIEKKTRSDEVMSMFDLYVWEKAHEQRIDELNNMNHNVYLDYGRSQKVNPLNQWKHLISRLKRSKTNKPLTNTPKTSKK